MDDRLNCILLLPYLYFFVKLRGYSRLGSPWTVFRSKTLELHHLNHERCLFVNTANQETCLLLTNGLGFLLLPLFSGPQTQNTIFQTSVKTIKKSNKGFSGVYGVQNVEGSVKIFPSNLSRCCIVRDDRAWAAWMRLDSSSLFSLESAVPSNSGFGSLSIFPVFQNGLSHLSLTLRQSLLMWWGL